MDNKLTVLLGAGASHDCVTEGVTQYDPDYRPPITKELFSFRPAFNRILRKYPKAESLSDEIRIKVNSGTNLESILSQLKSETDLSIKKHYLQIPLYLQELLGEVSTHFVLAGATKYDTLVRLIQTSRFNKVMYLTLNYDLLLDGALTRFYDARLNQLSHYCDQNRNWSLIKLHGSVNWGNKLLSTNRTIENATALLDSLVDEPIFDTEIQILKGHRDESRFVGNWFFYPALAVPIGGKKTSVCPEEHVKHAESFLGSCSNFLIIGFSALDQDVLEQLKLVRTLKNLVIVNESEAEVRNTLKRIGTVNSTFSSHARYFDVFSPIGFRNFVDKGELALFLKRK